MPAQGTSAAELDFASVQRDNPEMQRRCATSFQYVCGRVDRLPRGGNVIHHDAGLAGALLRSGPTLQDDLAGRQAAFQEI